MTHKICFCPASVNWIIRHLKKSAKTQFRQMIASGASITKFSRKRRKGKRKAKSRKHRSAKQRAATRNLIAFNRRRR